MCPSFNSFSLLQAQSALRHLYPCLPVCSAASLGAQSLLLNNLVLLYVLLPPCVWLSLSILQHLLSEISLSPVRWCWEQPSLYPPFPSYPPRFPLFPFLTYMHVFNRLFLLWGEHKRCLLSISRSPCRCLPFVRFLPPLSSLDLWQRAAHPSRGCCFA